MNDYLYTTDGETANLTLLEPTATKEHEMIGSTKYGNLYINRGFQITPEQRDEAMAMIIGAWES